MPQTLEKQGLGTIIVHNTAGDLPSLTGISYITLFTTADYAKSNGPALRAYVHGVQEAVQWMKNNQDEAIKILGEEWFKNTAPEALKMSFERLLPAISPTGTFTEQALEKVAARLQKGRRGCRSRSARRRALDQRLHQELTPAA